MIKGRMIVGYALILLGMMALLTGWKISSFDYWLTDYTLPSLTQAYDQLKEMSEKNSSSSNPKDQLYVFRDALNQIEDTYIVKREKSWPSIMFSVFTMFMGAFYALFGWGVMRGKAIVRRAFPAGIGLTLLTSTGLLFWGYYYNATVTEPLISQMIEVARSQGFDIQSYILNRLKITELTPWFVFKATMLGPGLGISAFLMFVYVALPLVVIKKLPIFSK